MTRRERLEAKVEKREQWAQGRETEAQKRFANADRDAEAFWGGQPILVGHHSEKRARALQEKIHRNGFAGVENLKMAEYHREKAEGLSNYLDKAIFDDDPDALEKLEAKVASLEKRQEFMVTANKICRSKKLNDSEKIAEIIDLGADEEEAKEVVLPQYDWKRPGFISASLTNNNANIKRCKDRIATIKAAQALKERAENSESGIIIDKIRGDRARITFSEKPEREIINALKNAGFRWNKCCWIGNYADIPESIRN